MKIVGVLRAKETAGKPRADRAIMRAVAKNLKNFEHKVVLIDEKKMDGNLLAHNANLVFSMARTPRALNLLLLFSNFLPIVNLAGCTLLSLNRRHLHKEMETRGIPVPKTRCMSLEEIWKLPFPYVVKQASAHRMKKDVIIVDSPCRRREAINLFAGRAQAGALVQEFVEGERRKFYGIGPEVFLLGGGYELPRAEAEMVKAYARHIGRDLMSLHIYGGKYIYTKEGEPVFTELNDWPSFSPMRDQAAQKIANLLLRHV